jgi:membrane protein required for colicin V production
VKKVKMADATIVFFLFVCLIRGIFKGPVHELFSIAGVLVGLLVAASYFPIISNLLSGWIDSTQLRHLVCFLALFGCTYFLISLSGVFATYLLRLPPLGWINRTFGAGFGALIGVLLIAVVLVPLVTFLPRNSTWIGSSILLRYENSLSEEMARIVPTTLQNQFSSNIDYYKEVWLHERERL